ncbi:hypothetical protein J2Z64_001349 [Oceanobacillus polygoni]|uniref:Uncharacterized protein n=1 Tax=Oceanobacillus polygoni TaxID=1235259 RepID=A0A9X0YR04_9BACI|nr:hypothetical protein [Oceanobacillus polygoni]
MAHYFLVNGFKVSKEDRTEHLVSYRKYIPDSKKPEILINNLDISLLCVHLSEKSQNANLIIKATNDTSAVRLRIPFSSTTP